MEDVLLQKWVQKLSLQDQSLLVSSLRGYDAETMVDINSNTISFNLKDITKMLRYVIVNTGNNKVYATDKILPVEDFAKLLGYYGIIFSNHWYDHIYGTIKIIAKNHPDNYISYYYKNVIEYISKKIPILPNYVYRLEREKYELKIKIDKLTIWIDSNSSDVTDDQKEQLHHMTSYYNIVSNRLHKYYVVNNLPVDGTSLAINKY